MKPWNAGNTKGHITRPLRHNGTPYQGINILLLWGESVAKGYAANIWMTYKQAEGIGAQVRKPERARWARLGLARRKALRLGITGRCLRKLAPEKAIRARCSDHIPSTAAEGAALAYFHRRAIAIS